MQAQAPALDQTANPLLGSPDRWPSLTEPFEGSSSIRFSSSLMAAANRLWGRGDGAVARQVGMCRCGTGA